MNAGYPLLWRDIASRPASRGAASSFAETHASPVAATFAMTGLTAVEGYLLGGVDGVVGLVLGGIDFCLGVPEFPLQGVDWVVRQRESGG